MQCHNLKLVIKRALKSPLPIALIMIWLIMATMVSLPTVLLSGTFVVGAIMAYIVLKLRDESFIRTAIGDEHERQHKDDVRERTFRMEELDVESRVKIKAIVKLQNEIAEIVSDSPVNEITAGLCDTVAKTEELTDRSLSMAQQRRELMRYLTKNDESSITARIASLESKLQLEQDPTRQAEITASLSILQKELQDYQAIELASQRILDQLDTIEISFSGLKARLVRITSTNISDWVAANTELTTELGGLSSTVDTLETSINEVLNLGIRPQ